MSIDIIQQRLNNYRCKTRLDEMNAMKEITQEIALMALSKVDFFKKVEFHGGTALRILYGLQRFSEDLDFALIKPEPQFELHPYLKHMIEDFEAFGYNVQVSDRSKTTITVQKEFLKVDSIGKLLTLQYPLKKDDKKIKIKFEVDTNPPLGATTEIKFLNFPFPYSILAKDLPSSFAGKMHALLCRSFNKGRDWYDFIWYVMNKTPLNYTLLANALKQQGPWKEQDIILDKEWLLYELTNKIQSIHWTNMTDDVHALMKQHELASLNLWNTEFFLAQVSEMKKYL